MDHELELILVFTPLFVFVGYMVISTFRNPLYQTFVRPLWRDDFKMRTAFSKGSGHMSPKEFLKDKFLGTHYYRFHIIQMKKGEYETDYDRMTFSSGTNKILRDNYEANTL